MLPGFRFLFAAIALSVSVLIFGLGAAALLRAAHEEFASNSSWRAAPEPPMLAQKTDAPPQVLAMLRVEPQHESMRPTATDAPPASAIATASHARSAPAEPESMVSTAPATEKVAALSPQDMPVPVGTPQTDTQPAETASANGTSSAAAPAPAEDTKVAAIEDARQDTKPQASDAPAAATEAAKPDATTAEAVKSDVTNVEVAKSEPAKPEPDKAEPEAAPATATTDTTATKVASLGDAISAKEQAAPKKDTNEKAERSIDRERLQAERRAKARRRLAAQRAQLARQQAAAQQLQLGLFPQPLNPAQQPNSARKP